MDSNINAKCIEYIYLSTIHNSELFSNYVSFTLHIHYRLNVWG